MKRFIQGIVLVVGFGVWAGCAPSPVYVVPQQSEATSVPNVAGTWQTTWGPEVCQLTLNQNGVDVTGAYETTGAPPGSVSGHLEGNVLTGTWSDAGGGGGGMRLVISADGSTFTGTWGSGGSDSSGGDWNGHR